MSDHKCTEKDRIEAIHNDYGKISETLSRFVIAQVSSNAESKASLKSIESHLCRINGSVARHQKSISDLEHFVTNHNSTETIKKQYQEDSKAAKIQQQKEAKANRRLFIAALLALIGSIIVNLVS